ncbi:succinate dehydrogenase assembly factor 3, mitochondrial [Hydra vulgaris]|nr:succinate dehydrogenase assembly factor 3, mitochondrial [Hydra vulgaris]
MQERTIARLFLVQRLYRQILKLHRYLPNDLKKLGDQYVKEEFRRHKGANQLQAYEFMTEWKFYCDTLQKQITLPPSSLGVPLDPEKVNSLSQEQLGQLFHLQQEATKKI